MIKQSWIAYWTPKSN